MHGGEHSRTRSWTWSSARPIAIAALLAGFFMMGGTPAEGASNFRLVLSPLPTSGPTTVEAVTCMPETVCEVIGTLSTGKTTMFRSVNGGISWGRQNVPPTVSDLSSISCPSTERCAAVGGSAANIGTAAFTQNKGVTWSPVKLPSGTGLLSGVACPSVLLCTAVGSSKSGKWLILQSSTGGASWSVSFSPNTYGVLTGLSCSTELFCMAVGYMADNTGAERVAGTTSSDGGQRWVQMASLAEKLHEVHAVACNQNAKITTCVVAGQKSVALGGGIFVSSTRGKSWVDRSLGARFANASSVDCTSSLNCHLVGSTSTGKAASYFTGNAGNTWDPVTVPSTALALQGIGCATAGRCVAFSQQQTPTGSPGVYRS